MKKRRCVRLVWALALVAVSSGVGGLQGSSAEDVHAFALLANNRLMGFSPVTGSVDFSISLGGAAAADSVGRYLAYSPAHDWIYVLSQNPQRRASTLSVVDLATHTLTRRIQLERGTQFRSLAVGRRTGRVFLFGHVSGVERGRRFERLVIVVKNPVGTRTLARWLVAKSRAFDWRIFQGAVSPNEGTVFVSYHGSSTSGADSFAVTAKGLIPCQTAHPPGRGCIPVHGAIEPFNDQLLGTAGDPAWIRLMTRSGKIIKTFATGLARNHLMQFTLDPLNRIAYAIGSCGYTGGLSRIDLGTGAAKLIGYPAPPSSGEALRSGICGERVAIVSGSMLILAKLHKPVPQWGKSGALLIADGSTGQIIESIPVPSEPIDVISQ